MDLFRHKLTGNLLGFKCRIENHKVVTYYVLNEDKTHQYTSAGFSTQKQAIKLAVCQDKNVERVTV